MDAAPSFLAVLDQPALWRAALTCVLLGVSASLLGCVLVVRRLALMGDALAHALLPGLGIAWLTVGASVGALLVGGVVAGLITALGSALVSRLTRLKEDVAFAALFTTCYAAGVALVSKAGTPVDLLHFLFGNVLAVGAGDLWFAAGASILTVTVFAAGFRAILLECFDPVFHRSVRGRGTAVHLGLLVLIVVNLVGALHALGVVLALGLFLLPAATAYLWCERWTAMLGLSAVVAVVGSLAGLVLGVAFDLPPGPAVVGTLGLGFLLSAVLSPRHGLLARLLRPAWHQHEQDPQACELPAADGGTAVERHG